MKGIFTFAAVVAAFQIQTVQARTPAAAKASSASTTASYSSESYGDRKNVISPSIGWMGAGMNAFKEDDTKPVATFVNSGLFAIGFEYEYMLKEDFSVGGFLRYYNTADSRGGTKYEDTAFLLGPMVHAYLVNNTNWMAYVGTGFTILSLKEKQSAGGNSQTISPDMTLGLPISMGIAYKFTPMLSAGIEHNEVMALGSDVNGWVISDFLLRLRLALAN